MDFKIDCEVKRLVKMGLSEDMASIIACGNFGVPEHVDYQLEKMRQENELLQQELKKFVPFSIDESTIENKKSDIQHKFK